MKREVGKRYSFKKLEMYLQKWENRCRAVVVQDEFGDRGIMHVFAGNFCGDWRSGDGIIFWNNADVTSAEPEDEFKVLQIIKF